MFALTVLDSSRPISVAMIDIEVMLGVVVFIIEEIVTVKEAAMVPVAISPVIAVLVTIRIWSL